MFHVPEHGSSKIDVVLDQPHATVSRPASFVVVSDDVVIGRIGVGGQIPLDQVTSFVRCESEENVQTVDVAGVETDGVSSFGSRVAVLEEVVGLLWRTSHFAGSVQTEDQEIENETVVLEDKGRELETTDEAIRIGVSHVWKTSQDIELF